MLTDPSNTAQQASARRAAKFERRLSQVESIAGSMTFEDDGPTGFGNPPKPSGSPPNGTIATGYYPNKIAGFRTWTWTRANDEWYGALMSS